MHDWRQILSWRVVPEFLYHQFEGKTDDELFDLWHECQDEIDKQISGEISTGTYAYRMTDALNKEFKYRGIDPYDARFQYRSNDD